MTSAPLFAAALAFTSFAWADEPPSAGQAQQASQTEKKVFTVSIGQRVPMTVVKTISTKSAQPGDPVYLVTTFPVYADGRIVIPVGSYVNGSITDVKRPGKVKGKGMFRMTLESVLLPNGVKHEFRAGLSDVAGTSGEKLDKKEGVVVGPGSKLNDLKNIQTGGSIGAMGGSAVGAASTIASGASTNTRVFTGGGIGAGAGLVGGLVATLLTRGPDAVLLRGADIEMEFNQPVVFEEAELAGLPAPPPGLPAQVSHPQQPADPSGLRRR